MSFSEWDSYYFKDITVNYDKLRKPLSAKEREKIQGNYPYYGAQGIIDHINDYIFDGTYILIAEDGENLKSNKQKIAQFVKGQFWVNNHAHVIKNNQLSDLRYLCYAFNNKDISGYITGSAQPKLSQANLNQIEFTLPQLPEQKTIAATLSCLDDVIELNNRTNQVLEEMAQAVFKCWFVDFEFPNESGEPYKSSGGEMVDSELGEIPVGWKVKGLYDFAEYFNGASFKKEEYSTNGYPIIKIVELKNGITSTTQYFNGIKDSKYFIKTGDILFSWSGNPQTSIDTFIWTGGQAILNQHTFRVEIKNNDYSFIYLLLKFFKPEFTRIACNKQTTGLGHVTVGDLKRIKFSYNTNVVYEFCAKVDSMIQIYMNNLMEIEMIKVIRDTLLPKLISGEIRVSVEEVI